MTIYSYRLNTPSTSEVVAGVLFEAAVNIDFAEDNLELNEWVPDRLDRYVDNVLSNDNLITPYYPSKNAIYHNPALRANGVNAAGEILTSTGASIEARFYNIEHNNLLPQEILDTVADEVSSQITARSAGNETVTGGWNFTSGITIGAVSIQNFTLVTTSNDANQLVTSFSAANYKSVKYQIQATSGEHTQMTEVGVVHDNTQTFMVEYATINNGQQVATFTTDILNGVCRLLCSPVDPDTTVRVVRVLISN